MRNVMVLTGAVLLALCAAPNAFAENGLPPGVFPAGHDYKAAPGGAYDVDPNHTAVVAKISHLGYSQSVFRFADVVGTLTWDPDNVEKSSLNVTVKTASIATPVSGFAAQLAGKGWLDSEAFPEAKFVSTKFTKVNATHGKVSGELTLMGKTKPVVFDVTLGGAGRGFMGHPRIGAESIAQIHPADFGLSPMLGDTIELVIDSEFAKK